MFCYRHSSRHENHDHRNSQHDVRLVIFIYKIFYDFKIICASFCINVFICLRTHSNSVHMTASPSDRESAVSLTSRGDSQLNNMSRERGKSGIVKFFY